jgi:hypothetical protein
MRSTFIIVALVAAPTTAFADEPAASANAESLVLPAKRLFLHAFVEVNLSEDSVFKPFSITPDVYYGVNEKITAGLIHSSTAATGFIGDIGNSLCLAGADNGCGDVYNGLGVDVRYQLKATETYTLAANPALLVNSIDPFQVALKVGVVGRYRPSPGSKLAVDFAPNVQFGVTEREPDVEMGEGEVVVATTNKEIVFAPVTAQYAVTPKLAGMVQTGLVLPLSETGDTYAIPFALGVNFAVNKQLTLDAAFALPVLAGGDAQLASGFDLRTFTIGGGYAF